MGADFHKQLKKLWVKDTFVKELRVNQNARHNYNTVFLIALPGKGCEIRFENVYLD